MQLSPPSLVRPGNRPQPSSPAHRDRRPGRPPFRRHVCVARKSVPSVSCPPSVAGSGHRVPAIPCVAVLLSFAARARSVSELSTDSAPLVMQALARHSDIRRSGMQANLCIYCTHLVARISRARRSVAARGTQPGSGVPLSRETTARRLALTRVGRCAWPAKHSSRACASISSARPGWPRTTRAASAASRSRSRQRA